MHCVFGGADEVGYLASDGSLQAAEDVSFTELFSSAAHDLVVLPREVG
jgi:hypothetical protein